jgi:hypothetical protein
LITSEISRDMGLPGVTSVKGIEKRHLAKG